MSATPALDKILEPAAAITSDNIFVEVMKATYTFNHEHLARCYAERPDWCSWEMISRWYCQHMIVLSYSYGDKLPEKMGFSPESCAAIRQGKEEKRNV
jgi:hypothetical protein